MAAIFGLVSAGIGCGATPPQVTRAASDVPPSYAAWVAVSFARAQVGKPYCWGGRGPSCFDCSGLTQSSWRAAGVAIPRTAEAQAEGLTEVPLDALIPGDILYRPGHVTIYVGGGMVVDATGRSKGILLRPLRPTFTRALRPIDGWTQHTAVGMRY